MDGMRICVISSGLDRFRKSCGDKFKQQVGVAKHPIDYYGLFWYPVESPIAHDYVKGFRRIVIWTTPQREFNDLPEGVLQAAETKPKNFFSMALGKHLLGDQLTIQHLWEQYDLFIYARPDICFDLQLEYVDIWEQLQSTDLLFPSNGHWRGGVNDQVCIGNRQMKSYLGLFAKLDQYIRDGVMVHPETMLKHHLTVERIRWSSYAVQNYIFRDEDSFQLG